MAAYRVSIGGVAPRTRRKDVAAMAAYQRRHVAAGMSIMAYRVISSVLAKSGGEIISGIIFGVAKLA